MDCKNSKITSSDGEEPKPVEDVSAPVEELSDWEQRLQAARIEREKVLSAKDSSLPSDKDTDKDHASDEALRTGKSTSFEGRLAAAREARRIVQENKKSDGRIKRNLTFNLRPLVHELKKSATGEKLRFSKGKAARQEPKEALSAEKSARHPQLNTEAEYEAPIPAPQQAIADDANTTPAPNASRTLIPSWASTVKGGAIGATLCLAVLVLVSTDGEPVNTTTDAGISSSTNADASPVSPVATSTGLTPFPAIRDLVVVVGSDAADVENQLGDTTYELRPTAFRINQSTVEYFNDEDAAAAAELAKIIGAEIIDLRGILPSPPSGQVVIHLASDDV